jgi:hypothetical protein
MLDSPRLITYHDLDFEKVQIPWKYSCGQTYSRWIDTGMPKIPEQILYCAPYLYESAVDARAGTNPGGTGFLFCIPSEDGPFSHHYCVSNHHVAIEKGCSCFRVIRGDGSVDVFEFDNSDWHFMPGSDVAVVPLDFSRVQGLRSSFIGGQTIFGNEKISSEAIGPGDDVFMIGLFLDVNAAETNLPAARFGNISTSPIKISIHPYKDKLYCIDMHSRTGYSGSPVFVYRTPGSELDWIVNENHVFRGTMFGLLGIHTGQFPDWMEVVRGDEKVSKEHKEYVRGLSAMNMVAPTQVILDTLKMDKLKEMRAQEARVVLKNYRLPDPGVLESARQVYNPDFNHLYWHS